METEIWECDVCGIKAKIPVGSGEPKHNCKARGLGDVVAKGLKSIGITKKRTSRVKQILTGDDYAECGCKGRQGWLNSLWSFKGNDDDNTDIEMPWYALEDEAVLSRKAISKAIPVWSHPSEDALSVVTSPFLFSESRFFGESPELAYLASYDIDGIFLKDIFPEPGKLEGESYEKVLYEAEMTNAVRGVEVKLLTGRHPRYRKVTEDWFLANGVDVFSMEMYTGDEFEHEKHVGFKAKAYSKSKSLVYIESDPVQAKGIYDGTLKTVVCPEIKKVFTNRQALHEIQKEAGYLV